MRSAHQVQPVDVVELRRDLQSKRKQSSQACADTDVESDARYTTPLSTETMSVQLKTYRMMSLLTKLCICRVTFFGEKTTFLLTCWRL